MRAAIGRDASTVDQSPCSRSNIQEIPPVTGRRGDSEETFRADDFQVLPRVPYRHACQTRLS